MDKNFMPTTKSDYQTLNEIKGQVSSRQKVLAAEAVKREEMEEEMKRNYIQIQGHDRKW